MSDTAHNPLFYDALTGLPNRLLLVERIAHEIDVADRHGNALALVHLNPFPFSEINAQLGFEVGDALLRQLGGRLRERVRKVDTLAHLNGDEFALLLPEVEQEGVMNLCSRVAQWFDEPFEVAGESIFLGVNMGVATYPLQCADATELLRGAMTAAREAKHHREPIMVYRGGMEALGSENLRLFGVLREAIQKDKLNLNFQPQLSINKGEVSGFEALSRWDEKQISPGWFIPVAESTGLIRDFTRWMIRRCLQQAAHWQQLGVRVPVSMNVSVRDLLNPGMSGEITGWVGELGLEGYPLVIEVTEHAVMQHRAVALRALNNFRDLGFDISIDDFGTGYSSLAYLRDLPAGELKIDQSFIFDLASRPDNQKLVRAVIGLGHEFGMRLVAEGVENRRDFELLAEFGCDIAQGYFISRPLSGEDLPPWLAAGAWPRAAAVGAA